MSLIDWLGKRLMDSVEEEIQSYQELAELQLEPGLASRVFLELDAAKTRKMLERFGASLLKEGRRTKRVRGNKRDKMLQILGRTLSREIGTIRDDAAASRTQQREIARVGDTRELKRLRRMDPQDFEYWCGGYFERHGFKNVTVTSYGNDFGVDVHMFRADGKEAIVQCKRYNGSVGRPTVQQTYGATQLLDADVCYVATTGSFTKHARELGRRRDIVLLDGEYLTSRRKPAGSPR